MSTSSLIKSQAKWSLVDNEVRPERPLVVVLSHDHALVDLMRSLLGDFGVDVYSDQIRARLISAVARLRPAAIVLDVKLGTEELAWEVLVALKHHPRTSCVPVLACVAAGWIVEKQAPFLERHGVMTWSNPFDLADLLTKIGALVPSLAA